MAPQLTEVRRCPAQREAPLAGPLAAVEPMPALVPLLFVVELVPAAPPVAPLCDGFVVSAVPELVVAVELPVPLVPVAVSSRRWHAVKDAAAMTVTRPSRAIFEAFMRNFLVEKSG
jgi:hypothetical protein